ncbi:helix-turn-helix domain-containing protein [Flavobacterium sp. TP390]|uniref:Helix-turn-helix domain-containing protein n=1 Tax=Flavobacterium profundi TaxID=1774945 RepID=A0A6I4IDL0_9FLAO|nr:AraC family transcriptional regulator [Flavobacterium profundi]MVO07743.1 helix-turn-helix domain-containing protein [Flavobacterium profundi]
MKNIFLLSFLFLLQFAFTQIDKKEVKEMSYDELKKGFFENDGNLLLQKKYANEFIQKAKTENNQSKLARGYYYFSLINNDKLKIVYFDSIINYTKTPISDKNFPIVAYYEKAMFLESLFRYDEAIDNYLKAEKISLERNTDYYYHCKFAIGILKSEKMGEVEEALPLFKEFNAFFESKKNDSIFSYDYENSLFALADAYKSLKKLDSSSYYNNIGYYHSKKFNNKNLNGIFILNEGANQVLKGNYRAAIDSINKALPILKEINDIGNNILASYFYYGKAYEGLKENENAVISFIKVDSIYQNTKIITPEFTDGYRFLINYYKEKDDIKKQLYYINTLMTIDTLFQKNYRILTRKIQKDYDIPHLIKEKESIIEELNNGKKKNYFFIGILFLIISISIFLNIRQTRLKKKYKKRFEDLIKNKPNNINKDIIAENKIATPTSENLGIAEEVIEMILHQLETFETNKGYLNSNLTVQNLAQEFNTNSKYLSIIINAKKEKNFVNYINELRIDYIVNELKENKTLSKFTMSAIAEEAGFNTAESFSNAFFKKTGIKPSYFIKELKNI